MNDQRSVSLVDIIRILSIITDKTRNSVKLTDYLVKDLDLSSVEIIDFIFELEKHYSAGIKISDFISESTMSVSETYRDFSIALVIEVIEKKLK